MQSVAVDLVVISLLNFKIPKVLLIRRGKDPFKGLLAFPGGFLDNNESAEDAVLRELKEECSLELPTNNKPYLFKVCSKPDRDPRGRVISLVYFVEYNQEPFPVKGADDAAEAVWMDTQSPELEKMGFDHAETMREIMDFLMVGPHDGPLD